MIVQFFNRGKGGGAGSVDYLLGRDRRREDARLLRGNADETIALIDGSTYAKKYTSGCLSFEESNLSEARKQQLMDSFEECIFTGLDADQYNCLWVEHRDKGRLELNFVIPNIELTTGKRLQPYYHAADHKRVDAWRTIQNIQYGLSDPDDPLKKRGLVIAKDLPRETKQAVEAINTGLNSLALAGKVKSRADVIDALQSSGFEMARTTKTSISIKNPVPGKQNIRLKGALYEQDFRLSKEFRASIEARSENHRRNSTERLHAARECYQIGIEKKRAEHSRRHSRSTREMAPDNIKTILDKYRDLGQHHVDTTDINVFSGYEDKQPDSRIEKNTKQYRDAEQQNEWNTSELLHSERREARSVCGYRQEEHGTIRQEWRISRDINKKIRIDDDRDRNHITESIGRLRADATRRSAANKTITHAIEQRSNGTERTSERIAERKRYFDRAAKAISRGVDSLRDVYNKLKTTVENRLSVRQDT